MATEPVLKTVDRNRLVGSTPTLSVRFAQWYCMDCGLVVKSDLYGRRGAIYDAEHNAPDGSTCLGTQRHRVFVISYTYYSVPLEHMRTVSEPVGSRLP
jgi:hypothetical protein